MARLLSLCLVLVISCPLVTNSKSLVIDRCELFANNGIIHQSAACYKDKLFYVSDHLSSITLYDLKDTVILKHKRIVHSRKMSAKEASVFHCNQSTFGKLFYTPADEYPLLYISERNDSLKRCFVEVFRLSIKYNAEGKAVGFTPCKVQKIYFPPMTTLNALGNANVVVDPQTGYVYTYSRNNNKNDSNYRKCRITQWTIPQSGDSIVFLADSDIIDSYEIGCSAYAMQGGCINEGVLYIGQGYKKQAVLRIVDLKKKKLVKTINLPKIGYMLEPEGCFWYDGNLMISSGKIIYKFYHA